MFFKLKTQNSKFNIAFLSRLLFLAVFLVLFILTDYRGKDEIPYAVNIFFRLDPLVLVTHLLSTRTFLVLLLPAVIVLGVSLLLGRFFCGWICPLGTVIDLATKKIPRGKMPRFLQGHARYYLLLALLFAALFGINIAGLFDPLAILLRFVTFTLYPLFGQAVRGGWAGLYHLLGDSRDYLDAPYGVLRDYLLPFRETFYPLAFLSLLLFAGVLALELFGRRTWCRYLCPLGTLLSLVSRFSLLKRVPGRSCSDCDHCSALCPATEEDGKLEQQECLRCMSCQSWCMKKRVRFRFAVPAHPFDRTFSPQRRVLLGGMLSGFLLSKIFATVGAPASLRPPGVEDEKTFLQKCVRCGECMKVCSRNALYPGGFSSGLYSIYTPVLIPRLGYCEYNCTLCGQVCPTEAIPRLPLQEKQKAVIGHAVIDRNLCLPYAKNTPCLVCEEHCPVPGKAIRLQEDRGKGGTGTTEPRKPMVDENLCNGCGICEFVCPLEEKSAIKVYPLKSRQTG